MTSLALLMLTDGRFPAGGYAHSAGLEAAVADGLEAGELPRFLADRLAAISAPDCALTVAAVRAARGGGLDALLELDAEAEARVPSPPLRVASRRLGAQLLRSAAVVWPDRALIGAYRDASAVTPRPVAFGVVAAATGLAEPETARAYLYDEASTVVAAAVRLLPIDTASALRLLASAEAELGRLAERAVAQAAEPRSIPASFAPAHELRSLRHARLEGRLFAT